MSCQNFTVCSASFSDCESLGLPFQCFKKKIPLLLPPFPSKKKRGSEERQEEKKRKSSHM